MELGIFFYHPKNPQNVTDIGTIAKYLNAELYVVLRPESRVVEGLQAIRGLKARVFNDFEEALRELPQNALYIVLETYGEKLLNELEIGGYNHVIVAVGAEDYGLPASIATRLPGNKVYVKIPVAVHGSSYNVVASLVMALYEIRRSLQREWPKPVRRYSPIDLFSQ